MVNIDITNPGVQKPHWEPWQSTMACCAGCSVPSLAAIPSTVQIARPSNDGKKRMQALIERRCTWPSSVNSASVTVQAPQSPSAQPSLVPVARSSSRR
jgi:hypothetical protein